MNIIKTYYPFLKTDIQEVLGYIPPGVATGLLCSLLIFFVCFLIKHKCRWQKFPLYFLFISYLAVVIQITYLSRQPGSRTDVALGLWDTWGTTLQSHAYVIENVLLFIPFGILFPMFGKWARFFCVPIALCSSLLLEGMQYVTGRGYCQLDDVVTNVMGACIGYVVFLILYYIVKMLIKGYKCERS